MEGDRVNSVHLTTFATPGFLASGRKRGGEGMGWERKNERGHSPFANV